MPECPHCGEHHSDDWFRLFTDNEGRLTRCPRGYFDYNDDYADYQHSWDIDPQG